jgi:hypothetical protein
MYPGPELNIYEMNLLNGTEYISALLKVRVYISSLGPRDIGTFYVTLLHI